eukprot:PITA_34254
MIKYFHQKSKVGGSTNSTFLALLTKEVNLGTFDRFRPISLYNSSYKILTKPLGNRIKPLLGKLISPTQGGVVKGRHILDNVIQVQEAIHSSYLRQEQGMLIKLDMANTFDWVNLSFLWNVDQQAIQRIALSLSFLGFTSWDKIKSLGLPITLGPNKLSLWKEVISKIKSKITTWGGQWLTNAGKLILIKSILSSLPIYQASFLLSPKMPIYQGSFLMSSKMPIYQASFLLAPKNITEQISRLIRDFMWKGGRGNQRKFHLVNLDIVKCPIPEEGLQIRDMSLPNLALGGKILWTLFSNSKHPVNQVIKKKYLKGSSLRNIQIDNSIKGTSIWHLYCRGIEFFQKHLCRILGNRQNMILWQDSIMGQLPLSKNEAIKEIRN